MHRPPPSRLSPAFGLLGLLAAFGVRADDAPPPPAGSPAFCLFELPAAGEKRVWINLGIVQYVEAGAGEVKIVYGGGNLGSGHETRVPVKTYEESEELLRRIRQTAQNCKGNPP